MKEQTDPQYEALISFLEGRHFKQCAGNILVDYDTGKEHDNVLFFNKKAGIGVEISESDGIAGICRCTQRATLEFDKAYVIIPNRTLYKDTFVLGILLDEFAGVAKQSKGKNEKSS